MTEPTTLQRCETFLEKRGMPERLRCEDAFWQIQNTVGRWCEIGDEQAIPLIKERLWEMLKDAGPKDYHRRHITNKWKGGTYCITVWDAYDGSSHEYTGPDELALLLAAAEEVVG